MVDDENSSEYKVENPVFSIASRNRTLVYQTKGGPEDKKAWMEAIRLVIRKLALNE